MPEQTDAELTANVGVVVTETVAVLMAKQLLDSPVTVYTVVTEGDGEIEIVVAPLSQVYVVAPLAISEAVFPEQIEDELTLTVGVMFTVIVAVLKVVQFQLAPDTVYAVVDTGEGLIEAVVAPVFQV